MDIRQEDHRFFYGWIVVGISFICLFATYGIRTSFGAYVAPWEQEFLIGRAQVTFVSVLSLLIFTFSQPFVGRMIDRVGARSVLTVSILLTGAGLMISSLATALWQLVVFYGLIASIGMAGGSTVMAAAVVAKWFVKKQGAVLGLVLSGMSAGQLVLGPVAIFLIDRYDWRSALLVIGAAVVVLIMPVCYFFVRSKPEDIGLRPYTGEEEAPDAAAAPAGSQESTGSIFSVFRRGVFWYLTIPYFVCGVTDVGIIGTHFIPYVEGKGFSPALIAVAFGSIAAFNIAGTVGAGFLTDRINRAKLLCAIYWVRALVYVILMTLGDHPAGVIAFAVLFGLTERATIAPTSSLCAHYFQHLSIGLVFSYASISHYLGATVGSFISGVLYDLTGSYFWAFAFSVVMLVGSGLLVLKANDQSRSKDIRNLKQA